MFFVNEQLCTGCGLCTKVCSEDAISLNSGKAEIDVSNCNECGLCISICPRRAITTDIFVSDIYNLKETMAGIKKRADWLSKRVNLIMVNKR